MPSYSAAMDGRRADVSTPLPGMLVGCLLVSGCMVLPRTTSTYDADCQAVRRQVTLEAQQVGPVGACRSGPECTGLLAFYGLVAAGSAVVSGSVAVVGNVAYWLEHQAQCRRGAPAPQGQASAASAGKSGAACQPGTAICAGRLL